jgi:hypothetical protein
LRPLNTLIDLRDRNEITGDTLRRVEHLLDLEELQILPEEN